LFLIIFIAVFILIVAIDIVLGRKKNDNDY